MKRRLVFGGGCLLVAGAALMVPVGGGTVTAIDSRAPNTMGVKKDVSFSDVSSERPKSPLGLLFIHHSVGGRLLADAGERDRVAEEVWRSHPEGGGLRRLLEQQGYQVHEASYGSALGNDTDRRDWLTKFRDHMDGLLACSMNDQRLPDGHHNRIVVWKSCFPENLLQDEAALAEARASLSALLPIFAQHPDVLFVHLTSPPLAPSVPNEPAWKWLARTVLGKPQPWPRLVRSGPLARQLAQWMSSPDGWLKGYPQRNVAVFDLYDTLTDHGKSDFLAYPTGGGLDSHPSRAGNERAAAEFVPSLNRAVRRAGMADL